MESRPPSLPGLALERVSPPSPCDELDALEGRLLEAEEEAALPPRALPAPAGAAIGAVEAADDGGPRAPAPAPEVVLVLGPAAPAPPFSLVYSFFVSGIWI